jgi:hypothetical protein
MTHIYPRATILAAIVKASAENPTASEDTICEKVQQATGADIDLVRSVLNDAKTEAMESQS